MKDLSGYYLVTRADGIWPPDLLSTQQTAIHRYYPAGLQLVFKSGDLVAYQLGKLSPLLELTPSGVQTRFRSLPMGSATQFVDVDLMIIRKLTPDLIVVGFENSNAPSPLILKEKLELSDLVKSAQFVPIFDVRSAIADGDYIVRFEISPFLEGQKVLVRTDRYNPEPQAVALAPMGFQIMERSVSSAPLMSDQNKILDEVRSLDFSRVGPWIASRILFASSLSEKIQLELDFVNPVTEEEARSIVQKTPQELWKRSEEDSKYYAAVATLNLGQIIKLLKPPSEIAKISLPIPPLHVIAKKMALKK